MWIKILLLSITVSLDGFGAGMACAFKKQNITLRSKFIIAGLAAVMMFAGGAVGIYIMSFIPKEIMPLFSSIIFLTMGITTLIGSLRSRSHDYDTDSSEQIEAREGLAMGLSLDADCFFAGAAFGGSLKTLAIATVCAAAVQSLFITLGELIVKRRYSKGLKRASGGIISGLLFIFIAILQWV